MDNNKGINGSHSRTSQQTTPVEESAGMQGRAHGRDITKSPDSEPSRKQLSGTTHTGLTRFLWQRAISYIAAVAEWLTGTKATNEPPVESHRDKWMSAVDAWACEGNSSEDRAEAASRIKACFTSADETLDLSDLGLTSLPDAIGELDSVRMLYLNDNDLTTLPETLNSLEHLCVLDLTNNQLEKMSVTIKQMLSELKEKSGCNIHLEGNRLTFEDMELVTGDAKWKLFLNENIPEYKAFFSNQKNKQSWILLIDKLVECARLQKPSARNHYCERITLFLKAIQKDPSVLEHMETYLEEAVSTCEDKAQLIFSQMESQLRLLALCNNHASPNWNEILKMAQGTERLERINTEALHLYNRLEEAETDNLPFDDVEIMLDCQRRMQRKFQLPVHHEKMKYGSKIDHIEIENVSKIIENYEAENPDYLFDWLMEWTPWTQLVMSHHQDAIKKEKERHQARMEEIMEDDRLSSDELLKKSNELMREFNLLEKKLLETKTREHLEQFKASAP